MSRIIKTGVAIEVTPVKTFVLFDGYAHGKFIFLI